MAVTVFINYSSTKAGVAEHVRRRLTTAGVKVWVDHERLPPGTRDWDAAIRQGIQAAAVVLYLASPAALASPYVRSELLVARRFDRRIVPVWLVGEQWIDAAPLELGTMQYIDARGDRFQ